MHTSMQLEIGESWTHRDVCGLQWGLDIGESSTLDFDLCTVPIGHVHPGRIREMVQSGGFVGGWAAGLADWLVPLVDSRLWRETSP
jgi:hypothetical protein